jgi:hypothetical protein
MSVEKVSPVEMFRPPAPTTSMPGPGRSKAEPDDVSLRSLNTCIPATNAEEISVEIGRFQASLPSRVSTRFIDEPTLFEPSGLFAVNSSTS